MRSGRGAAVRSRAGSPGPGRRTVAPAAGVEATSGPLGPREGPGPPAAPGLGGRGEGQVPAPPGCPEGSGPSPLFQRLESPPRSTLEPLPRGRRGRGGGVATLLVPPATSPRNVNETDIGSAYAVPASEKAKGAQPSPRRWPAAPRYSLDALPGARRTPLGTARQSR